MIFNKKICCPKINSKRPLNSRWLPKRNWLSLQKRLSFSLGLLANSIKRLVEFGLEKNKKKIFGSSKIKNGRSIQDDRQNLI
jgi:hypothetical protein